MLPEILAELVVSTIKQAIAPLREELARLEGVQGVVVERVAALEGVRERVAILETKGLVQGPPGRDGIDGTNGADGLGFEDLAVAYDVETNALTLTFKRGEIVKAFPVTLPLPRYVGVYTAGATYTPGELVTFGGSTFICRTATSTKPETSSDWQLMVKRGRDGRDGRGV